MELSYTKCGDYEIPNIALTATTDYQIGRYGRMRQKFLKEYRPGTYSHMLLSETLWEHLAEIDAACNDRLDYLIPAMAAREGVTEVLKASDQMEWVGRMNNIRQRAEETVLYELVYAR